ncbi:MAG TPA: formate-dependent phosphoribosylglycinamide formyltransferase [Leptospiraceae bacterium]|nr:formate-dependent phosphoribosylglycinamide formyltransferase [Leptospiraceae bacterium]HNF12941.1 formate-dependent phosphoribosylglycinamide formyltransferase [Leptospiraceae bacterium]HNF25279.1 formate-dependent phosphoribosylglycinamide formyltransferase [Leptospiraceae bacterium]HNH07182.1 formate-dependent phosphoribosylglycinamide formyltransferase [Leptospiraceae bacterium]HNI98644.1 formate-dependent phosphoribosylglycinamide formyltransferase [Leptospiraceae bacterium]
MAKENLKIGSPFAANSTKILLLGSGELGKEFVLEAQRFGIHVMAVDRYPNAPAMQVAHESKVIDMLNAQELEKLVRSYNPHYIVPEIEAISTETLVKLESEGFNVIPSGKAVNLTMNREGIRDFAAKELGLKTSAFEFADSLEDFHDKVMKIGIPCVVKPIMSSSGKGQSIIRNESEIEKAWNYGQTGGRAGKGKMIVEEFIPFDFEITLLTVRHAAGTTFMDPIGHLQVNGDYVESWQPQPMSENALKKAKDIAEKVTAGLGGYGIFGVELFVKGDEVYFSEVSPRPHDTGMVTMISCTYSEFALHVRAILGLPIPKLRYHGPAASAAFLAEGNLDGPEFEGFEEAMQDSDTSFRLFGKPEVKGKRRMGVALALADSIEKAREKARAAVSKIKVI